MHEIALCAGSELVTRPKAKHRASDSPSHVSQRAAEGKHVFRLRQVLCSASRASRDTPQSSIVGIYHSTLFNFSSIAWSSHACRVGRTGSLSKAASIRPIVSCGNRSITPIRFPSFAAPGSLLPWSIRFAISASLKSDFPARLAPGRGVNGIVYIPYT